MPYSPSFVGELHERLSSAVIRDHVKEIDWELVGNYPPEETRLYEIPLATKSDLTDPYRGELAAIYREFGWEVTWREGPAAGSSVPWWWIGFKPCEE